MAETEKLKLPKVTGNMTWDVVRDLNALAEAVDGMAGEPDGIAVLNSEGKLPAEQLGMDTGEIVSKTELNELKSDVGNLDELNTESKESVVDAVNELEMKSKEFGQEIAQNGLDFMVHVAEEVHKGEVHGMRVTDGKLEYFDGQEWQRVRGDGYPVGPVMQFSAKASDGKITLTWRDPNDITITDSDGNTITIARWKGTKILRKVGGHPANENDGTLVVDSGVKNQYETIGFEDPGLANGTTYYYSAFSYTEEDVFDEKVDADATPMPFVNYGVRIDTSNPDPYGSLTYLADAEGFTPLKVTDGVVNYGSWEDTFLIRDIKVALIKDGAINYELNPDDYTKKADGSNADITSGNDGDVMVGLPLAYWKFEKIGNYLDVYIADAQVDSGYKAGAHTRGDVVQDDYVWISAYKGTEVSGKLRSLSGKTASANKTIGEFRTVAKANGDGYEQFTYYQMLLLQVMTLITTKSCDSQTALGMGYTNGNSSHASTGTTNTRGLFYGESTGKQQIKAFGIEDFYGNYYDWVDGFITSSTRELLISDADFNDTGNGYTNYGVGASSNVSGYISQIQGGNDTGFIGKEFVGSSTTHFCDHGHLIADCVALFGGFRSMGVGGAHAGAFYLHAYHAASFRGASVGARCSFLAVN